MEIGDCLSPISILYSLFSILQLLLPIRRRAKRHAHEHGGALAGRALDAQFAGQQPHALAHAHQPVPCTAAHAAARVARMPSAVPLRTVSRARGVQRRAHRSQQVVAVERLGQERGHGVLGSRDRRVARVAGHEDHRQARPALAGLHDQLDARHAGHHDVGHEHIARVEPLQSGRPALDGDDLIARRVQGALFTDMIRKPVHVNDLADALLELAANDYQGVLHVAGPDAISRYDLGVLIARREGLDPAQIPAATIAESGMHLPADVRLNTAKALSLLRTRLRGVYKFMGVPCDEALRHDGRWPGR